jgi:FkbM family methyltransferase
MPEFSYSQAQIAELISELTDPKTREAVELSSLPDILKGAGYFIDVGANVGLYTFHAAKYLRNAKLLAIEANPYLIPVLTKTVEDLRLNDGGGNDFEIKAGAVSDIPGPLAFHVSRFPTLSSVFPNQATQTVDVPTLRLDDFYRPDVPTVVKIDIEGGEYRALRSASRFLQSTHTSFFAELHGWGDKTIGKYPIHAAWLFLMHGYAIRKVGTHYWFYRSSWFNRTRSFLGQAPYLGLKFIVVRYGGGLHTSIAKYRNRSQR